MFQLDRAEYMQITSSVNTPNQSATRFLQTQNVSREKTMTSDELMIVINEARAEAGEPVIRRNKFAEKIEDELEGEHYTKRVVQNLNNTESSVFDLTHDQCMLISMRESKSVRRKVVAFLNGTQSRVLVTLPDFSNPAAAARAWAEQFELQQIASQALIDAAPKIAFVDAYVESTGLKGFRQTAKLLKANESRFREFLIDRKIMYRLGGEWQAYQPHIDAGRFDNKTGTSDSGHAFNQSKFTPKGVNWVAGLWAQYNLQGDL